MVVYMEQTETEIKKTILTAAVMVFIGFILIPLMLLVSFITLNQLRHAEFDGKGINTVRSIRTPFICSYSMHFTHVTDEYCGYKKFLSQQAGVVIDIIFLTVFSGVLLVYLIFVTGVITGIMLLRHYRKKIK